MRWKNFLHIVLTVCLALVSLISILGWLDGMQEYVYAAPFQPIGKSTAELFTSLLHPVQIPAIRPAAGLLTSGNKSVITVCRTGCAYADVQSAVNDVAEGGTVKVAQGVYTDINDADSVIRITKTLKLQGGYTVTNWSDADIIACPTVLDAQNKGRVVYIEDGVDAIIEGFHIRHGSVTGTSGGAGIYIAGGSSNVLLNYIYSNTAHISSGGGIYVADGTSVILDNHIYSNVAADQGGGVRIGGGSSLLQDNYIYSNTAADGGGIAVSNSSCDVRRNRIYTNRVTHQGGGIYIKGAGNVEQNWIYDNDVSGSTDNDPGGGGIFISDGFSTVVRGNKIYNNRINPSNSNECRGGGIFVFGGSVNIARNDIYNNEAFQAGGVQLRGVSGELRNNLIYSNTTPHNGAGIYLNSTNIAVENNTIYGNQVIDGNNGGGIYYESGTPNIRNNIVVSNSANSGGGVYGSVTVYYSDIWGNTGGRCDNNASCISADGNITDTPSFVDAGVDFRLQPDSPCRDAADPNTYPDVDYDNRARPFGARADMGAFEFYSGDCFAQVDEASRVYTDVHTAINTATTSVRVAGLCTGTFTISEPLALRGGYAISAGIAGGLWTTPTAQTTLDGSDGSGPVVTITGADAITVERFVLRNATATGGLHIAQALSPTVQNVVFYNNQGGGLLSAGGNPRLYNNTAVSNTGDGLIFNDGVPVISNTLLVSNTGYGISATLASPNLDYNAYWNNTNGDCNGCVSGTHSLSQDPRLECIFHLRPESPLLHRGDPDTALTWDFAGDRRDLDRGADIGADEADRYPDFRLRWDGWPGPSVIGVNPGATIWHDHRLTNTGNLTDTFTLTHTAQFTKTDGEAWDLSHVSAITLPAGESTWASVEVQVPDDVISGAQAVAALTITSQINEVVYETVTDTTVVSLYRAVQIDPLSYEEDLNPGDVVAYQHMMTNTGNMPDTFNLDVIEETYITATVAPTETTLASGESIPVLITVTVPPWMPGGLEGVTIVDVNNSDSRVQQSITETIPINHTPGTRYVNDSGDDDLNNCQVKTAPCRTIVHAVDQAASGDQIEVAEGIYDEHDITLNKNVTLSGGHKDDWTNYNPEWYPTILDARGLGRVLYIFGSPTVEGFTLRGGATDGSGGAVYIYSPGTPIVRGNIISGNVAGTYGGGIYNKRGNPIIEQNHLLYNQARRGGAFYSAAGTPSFWSNAIYDNEATENGGGVYVIGGDARIWHDTIYGNTAERGGGVYLGGGSPVVSNTIIAKNTATITGGGVYSQAAGAALDYNDVWDNTNGDLVGAILGPNGFSVDPRFRNVIGRNFRLYSSSPCRDAGDATSVPKDFEGHPRTLDAAPDIGADEFRRFDVDIEADTTGSGDSGSTVIFEHVVINMGNYTDTYAIDASSSWSTTPPDESVTIGSGMSETIQVAVDIPETAIGGTRNTMVVTATSLGDPSKIDKVDDTIEVIRRCEAAWKG
jgi:hypothetical protein